MGYEIFSAKFERVQDILHILCKVMKLFLEILVKYLKTRNVYDFKRSSTQNLFLNSKLFFCPLDTYICFVHLAKFFFHCF